jgi:hypothetical protein
MVLKRRYDTHHNDVQHNDTQHNDTERNGLICNTQHNGYQVASAVMLSVPFFIIMLSVVMLSETLSILLVKCVSWKQRDNLKCACIKRVYIIFFGI